MKSNPQLTSGASSPCSGMFKLGGSNVLLLIWVSVDKHVEEESHNVYKVPVDDGEL